MIVLFSMIMSLNLVFGIDWLNRFINEFSVMALFVSVVNIGLFFVSLFTVIVPLILK